MIYFTNRIILDLLHYKENRAFTPRKRMLTHTLLKGHYLGKTAGEETITAARAPLRGPTDMCLNCMLLTQNLVCKQELISSGY